MVQEPVDHCRRLVSKSEYYHTWMDFVLRLPLVSRTQRCRVQQELVGIE